MCDVPGGRAGAGTGAGAGAGAGGGCKVMSMKRQNDRYTRLKTLPSRNSIGWR